jgi:hypothetical protein
MYQPKHLQRWQELINYQGDNFDGYWIAHKRFFRCTPTERSNARYIKEHLQDCRNTEGLVFASFTDSIMLLRYYILIREDNEPALKMADMLAERIKRKGSLDPDMEQRMREEGVQRAWKQASLKRRVNYCRESGVSIFAARRSTPPESVAEALTE